MTNNYNLRFPAEWEKCDAVLLSWPHAGTDWEYMLDRVTECYINLVSAISEFSPVIIVVPDAEIVKKHLPTEVMNNVTVYEMPTNDTWARDFGPITLVDSAGFPTLLDFKFNAWGLKFAADKDNLITSNLVAINALNGNYQNHLGFVLEGGSIETDGKGLLLSTSECLLSKNRNGDRSKAEIENYLKSVLNIKKLLWLDHGYLAGDDTDSHIDTLARLAPGSTIIYVKCDDTEDEHYVALSAMEAQLKEFTDSDRNTFSLVPVPLPDPIYEDGERLPATYANYLVTDKAVFIPVYGQEKDSIAIEKISSVFKDKTCVPVDCNALIRQHGSLHCVTMQIIKRL
ncbi:MAG: agmatine deiminase family protein [Muribaculaceae bacterium]